MDVIRAEQYTVGQWMDMWFENWTKIKVRLSSHKTYRGYIDNHIKSSIDEKPIATNPTDSCALPKLEHREMKTPPAE